VLDHSQPLASALATAANTPADIHFDLILDAVGGDDLYAASLPFLAKGGRCV
jgi:NADPH:quinone reductase-like Zn-dependent oxidoreductase